MDDVGGEGSDLHQTVLVGGGLHDQTASRVTEMKLLQFSETFQTVISAEIQRLGMDVHV